MALLSILLSRFLMKTFPTPDLLREGIVHGLVVDTLIQILDEDVPDSGSSQRRVTLAPHDPDGATLEDIKVHGVQSALGVSRLLEVDVGVAERPPGDHVPAHPDGQDGAR